MKDPTFDVPGLTVGVAENLLRKKLRCGSCGRGDRIEVFYDTSHRHLASKDGLPMFAALQDYKVENFVPTMPYACDDCGIIGQVWLDTVRKWMADDA